MADRSDTADCPTTTDLYVTRADEPAHRPVTTLAELDTLDEAEMMAGFLSAEKGDPEPGANRTRSFHHGWRTRMMDLGEIPIPPEHRELTRQWVARMKSAR